jgi:cellulose 1,4-beta-cellobiosidase
MMSTTRWTARYIVGGVAVLTAAMTAWWVGTSSMTAPIGSQANTSYAGKAAAKAPAQAKAPARAGTSAEARSHVDNPYTGATGYINPDYAAAVRTVARSTGGSTGAAMAKVASQPTAVWLDRIATIAGGTGVKRTLTGHLDAALTQQRTAGRPLAITLVVYDLPNRDCAASASNGELTVAKKGLATYRTRYIDPIASILAKAKYAKLRIVTIVEPDSLPNLVTNLDLPKCAEASTSGAYVKGVQYALNKLHALPNVYTYLDVAHSGWLGWNDNLTKAAPLIADVVKGTRAGVSSVDGFVSNTANYTPVSEPFLKDADRQVGGQPVKSAPFYEYNPQLDERRYVTTMRAALIQAGMPSRIGMLIDTSRSGWGGAKRPTGGSASTALDTFVNESRIDRRLHRGNWCNQPGGIGPRPTTSPIPGVDAYVWIKPPGESDGTSDAGQTGPDQEGKSFDVMCDPNANSRANAAFRTGAMPAAPPAGKFFPAGLRVLVKNAYPPL